MKIKEYLLNLYFCLLAVVTMFCFIFSYEKAIENIIEGVAITMILTTVLVMSVIRVKGE